LDNLEKNLGGGGRKDKGKRMKDENGKDVIVAGKSRVRDRVRGQNVIVPGSEKMPWCS
jgi:hypothetical protein